MNMIECKVDNRWYWGLENAYLKFTSPKGGYVRIDKWKIDKLSDYQRKLIWELYERARWKNEVQLTISEMKTLVVMGYAAGATYIKKSK